MTIMNTLKTIPILLMLALSTASWAKTEVDVSAGLAYNANIYRSPTNDYVDYFANPNGSVIVNPLVQSGFFIPFNADVTYTNRLTKKWDFIADYDFRSHLYLKENFRNANQYRHVGSLGAKYKIHNFKKRKSSIYTGLILGDQQRDYYDRDTGNNKVRGDSLDDVSDLYSFSTVGAEVEYRYWRKLDWNFKLGLSMEQRDYAKVTIGSAYDHLFTRLELDYNYRFNRVFRLALDYSYTIQDYDERSSRNLHGQLFPRHPALEYHFQRIGFSVTQRIDRKLRFRYGYELTTREDQYVGYNDYTQNEFYASVRYRATNRLTLSGSAIIRDMHYPNAWNFDRDPAIHPAVTDNSHKSALNTNLVAEVDYRLNKRVSLFGSMAYRNNDNSDDRFNYDRTIFMVGANINLL